MTFLLDINVLLALGYDRHSLHDRAEFWANHLRGIGVAPEFATCSITELGFVRIACGVLGFAADVREAQLDLNRLKSRRSFTFLADDSGADRLPKWVQKSKQVTDGHLVQVAAARGATLATLDGGIPGALLIPKIPEGLQSVKERPSRYGMAA